MAALAAVAVLLCTCLRVFIVQENSYSFQDPDCCAKPPAREQITDKYSLPQTRRTNATCEIRLGIL